MIKHIALTIIGITLIYFSHYFMDNSINEKEALNLTVASESKGEAPEIVIATKLLGGFRGILIDILWIRAINLESEGKYFEIAQLFDLISKLEPRVPSVWSYASWNLTYNISKEVPELDQKWEWVKSGAYLLRNKGLVYCPREYKLYDDLAYIYYHKIGGSTDESNDYFKSMHATEMDIIFGDNFNTSDYLDNIPIDDIRKSKEGDELFYKLKDPIFRKLLFRTLVRQIKATDEIAELLKKYQKEKIFIDVVKYYRKQAIETELCMDLKIIKEVEGRYGKMEWKSAVSHGLYWAYAGMRNATAKQLTTERLETYILKDIFFFGSVYPIFDKNGNKHFEFGPDFSKAEVLHKQYLYYLDKYPSDNITMTFYYAYRSFLETIVLELYMRGDFKTAEKYFNEGKLPLKDYGMPATVQELVDGAFKKALSGRTDQEHIMMIFSPIERYYKDKFILKKIENTETFFANFIIKNYTEWKDKTVKSRTKLPPTLKEIQVLVLTKMINEYSGINQEYIDLLQQERDKLKGEVDNHEPQPDKK